MPPIVEYLVKRDSGLLFFIILKRVNPLGRVGGSSRLEPLAGFTLFKDVFFSFFSFSVPSCHNKHHAPSQLGPRYATKGPR